MHCTYKEAIYLVALTEPCVMCGRKPNEGHPGCGNCIGRGTYAYPNAYEDCDCGGYEKIKISKLKEAVNG